MGLFDFLRGAAARRHEAEAYQARVREEIARVQRGERMTGLFGGPPTREAQDFERRFAAQEAERRDLADVQAVRRGGLRQASDASLGPRARDERHYRERAERDRARREADEERRRLDEQRRLEDRRRQDDQRRLHEAQIARQRERDEREGRERDTRSRGGRW